jgi:hypothetical protein
MWKAAIALVASFGCVASGLAQDSFSVDMDLITPGIQNTRVASPGDTFTVGLVLSVDAAGVSSYSVSELFDKTELSLNGSPAASVPALPGGLFPLAAPVEKNALGQVYSVNGATLGIGPVSTIFTIGTVNYSAVTPLSDGLADIMLGFFNVGVDGLFDNAGNPVTPTFNPGYVESRSGPGTVPDTGSTLTMFLCALAALRLAGRAVGTGNSKGIARAILHPYNVIQP